MVEYSDSENMLSLLNYSCDIYYDYLVNNNKGASRVRVTSFTLLPVCVRFELQSALRDTENFFLEIDGENYYSVCKHEYDETEKVLICSVDKDIYGGLPHMH